MSDPKLLRQIGGDSSDAVKGNNAPAATLSRSRPSGDEQTDHAKALEGAESGSIKTKRSRDGASHDASISSNSRAAKGQTMTLT